LRWAELPKVAVIEAERDPGLGESRRDRALGGLLALQFLGEGDSSLQDRLRLGQMKALKVKQTEAHLGLSEIDRILRLFRMVSRQGLPETPGLVQLVFGLFHSGRGAKDVSQEAVSRGQVLAIVRLVGKLVGQTALKDEGLAELSFGFRRLTQGCIQPADAKM